MTVEDIQEINPEAILCDGFNDAIIGMAERINLGPVVAYSVEKMLDIMIARDGMTYEEALEYYDYNIAGAWLGDNTPIYIKTEFFKKKKTL
jgi:hypothetical protein